MKKILLLIILIIPAFSLFSCTEPENEPLTLQTVYLMAQEAGYSGSIEDFVAEFRGDKGDQGPVGDQGPAGADGSRTGRT